MRSTFRAGNHAAMSAGVPTTRGLTIRLADACRVVVDEADDLVGEVLLRQNLARHRARRRVGADDEHPLAERVQPRNVVEHQAPHQDAGQARHRRGQ